MTQRQRSIIRPDPDIDDSIAKVNFHRCTRNRLPERSDPFSNTVPGHHQPTATQARTPHAIETISNVGYRMTDSAENDPAATIER